MNTYFAKVVPFEVFLFFLERDKLAVLTKKP